MASELQWILGPDQAAVRSGDSHVYRLWPRPDEQGRTPIGLHMALSRPDDELYSDPSSTRAVVSRPMPTRAIGPGVGWSLLFALATAVGAGLLRGSAAWSGGPAGHIATQVDLIAAIIAAALGYGAAAAWEAGLCASQLEPGQPLFGWGAKGPSVEPVLWRMNLSVVSAWQSLLGPLLWCAALFCWPLPWPVVGTALATGSLLYLLRVCLPLRPSPVTRILEASLGLPDFSTGMRWALTTLFLPRNQRSASGRPRPLVAGALVLVVWVAAAGLAFPFLASSDVMAAGGASAIAVDPSESAPGRPVTSRNALGPADPGPPFTSSAPAGEIPLPRLVWGVLMGVVALGTALWLVEAIARLFRYALLFGGRVERRPVTPSRATNGLWQRQSALIKHVPAMSKLAWQWSEASPGTLLVRQDERDRSFHWLASGEARVVSRDAAGNVRKLATIRGGSGVGEVALLEDQPRTADVIVSATALVISLAFEAFERGIEGADRERFREVVYAGRAFANSAVFAGCPGPDRERWIRGGSPRRYAAGQRIIREGEDDRWMGLVVEGSVEVDQAGAHLAALGPSSVFGEFAFLHDTARNASLTATTPVLLWSWEPSWLDEEVERTSLRSQLEALAAQRSVQSLDQPAASQRG